MLPGLVFLQLAAVVGGRLPHLSYLPVLPQQGPPLPPRLALRELETPNLGLLRLEFAKEALVACVEVLGHVVISSLTGGLVLQHLQPLQFSTDLVLRGEIMN